MEETDDFVSGLQTVIDDIVRSIIRCEYTVPVLPPEQNEYVNPDDVKVLYFSGGGTTPIELSRSLDGCATGEWTYNADGTQIILCDSACTTVRNDPLAKIEVYFGCVIPV